MPNLRATEAEFLEDAHVASFSDWLAEVICGAVTIDYVAAPTTQFSTLSAAKRAYRWPPSTKVIPLPTGPITLPRWSGLNDNQVVLHRLSTGLLGALTARPRSDAALAAWMKAIFVWGGVYTKRGNAGWLTVMHGQLGTYMDRTLNVLRSALAEQGLDQLDDLRSNAGTTKVHSLVLPDFIIYDSRVAAALAWLVAKWICVTNGNEIPPLLRFGCMRANSGERKKRRTPDEHIFPYFSPVAGNLSSQRKHALWNLRANWLLHRSLTKATQECGTRSDFQSLRDVEAALFVMGADLSHAMPGVQACIEALAGGSPSKGKITTYRVDELKPLSGDKFTREGLERELDKRMNGNHDFWNRGGSSK